MSDTVGHALSQRLVNLSASLALFVSGWERATTAGGSGAHSSDFVQSYIEKFDQYFVSLLAELAAKGIDDPLFHFVPDRLDAAHLKAVADRLAMLAAQLERKGE